MKIVLNGETRDVARTKPWQSCWKNAAFHRPRRHRGERRLRAVQPARSRENCPMATGSRSSHRCRGDVKMKTFYGTELPNPLMLGTAQYPSPAILEQAFRESGAGRRHRIPSSRRCWGHGQTFWQMIRELGVLILPKHCWLSHGKRGRDHGPYGPRGL